MYNKHEHIQPVLTNNQHNEKSKNQLTYITKPATVIKVGFAGGDESPLYNEKHIGI